MSRTQDLLNSPEFKRLVTRRWTVAFILTALEFAMYYGYIGLVAWNKPLIAQKIGEFTTLGIPLGVLVIVVSWVFTFAYVIWANNSYDPEVERLNKKIKEG